LLLPRVSGQDYRKPGVFGYLEGFVLDQPDLKASAILPNSTAARSSAWLPAGCVLLIVLASLVFFRSAIFSLLQAWERPEYSHGYIIPFIALFIAVKRLKVAEPYQTRSSGVLPFGIFLIGLLAGLVGNLANIADLTSYGMLIALAGLIILTLGPRGGFRLWPAWVYLAFMLPLPNFLYWPLSIKLQFISSQLGVAMIKLMGVPVFLEGNIIDLGNYQLQVAEACSGLRYLFPLMSFGFLFATLYRGPVWQKLLLFFITIPITLIMNSVRIAIIGFLVDRYGIAQAEGFLHAFEGWVIFVVCIAVLFLTAILLQRFFGRRLPMSEALDLQYDGLVQRAKSARNVASIPWLATFAAVAVVAAVGSQPMFHKSSVYPDRRDFSQFPDEIAGWKGNRAFLDFQVERILGADDYLMSNFTKGTAKVETVNLLISYYRSQTEGSGIHSPEVCIPAGGWEVSRWAAARLDLSVPALAGLTVNRAIIQKGQARQLVYYWFEQRSRHMTNDYVVKIYTVWDSILTGRSDGALIRVVTPIDAQGVEAADQRLKQFLNDTAGSFTDFVPP
jgi:exosortase D (VPLPA-CTERM-specific)